MSADTEEPKLLPGQRRTTAFTTGVRLDVPTYHRLNEEARRLQITQSAMLRILVREALKAREAKRG